MSGRLGAADPLAGDPPADELTVAAGTTAYVDRGLADPPPLLCNTDSVIAASPGRHEVAYPAAMTYVGYLTGPAQARIEGFRTDGERAFRPLARSGGPNVEQYVPRDRP